MHSCTRRPVEVGCSCSFFPRALAYRHTLSPTYFRQYFVFCSGTRGQPFFRFFSCFTTQSHTYLWLGRLDPREGYVCQPGDGKEFANDLRTNHFFYNTGDEINRADYFLVATIYVFCAAIPFHSGRQPSPFSILSRWPHQPGATQKEGQRRSFVFLLRKCVCFRLIFSGCPSTPIGMTYSVYTTGRTTSREVTKGKSTQFFFFLSPPTFCEYI